MAKKESKAPETETIVKTYRVVGKYNIQKNVYKFNFEKEVRDTTPEGAVEKVKLDIASRSVDPRRIKIEAVYEITDQEAIRDRVIKSFEEENIVL